MQLALDDDQQFFQETTRKFLEQEMPITAVRALADEPAGFDAIWWRRGAELGWTSLLVPEEHGGGSLSGEGVVDLIIVAEELGRLAAPGPLLPTSIGALAIVERGSAALQADVLPGIVSGERLVAWCPVLPGSDGGVAGVEVRAEARDGGYVLDGVAAPVEAAAHSDDLLVTAVEAGGLTQFLVPVATPGISVEPLGSIDLVRRFATVRFDAVQVPASRVVGVAGDGADAARRQLHLAVVLQCAETVGALDRVLEFTLEYLADRTSFGRPLASYQALKHRVADMKMWLEASHGVTELAARAVQADADDVDEVVAAAASYVGEHATELVQECTQLHGGIGVTWEHDLHLYLRRVTLHRNLYGTPAQHRASLAARLLESELDDEGTDTSA